MTPLSYGNVIVDQERRSTPQPQFNAIIACSLGTLLSAVAGYYKAFSEHAPYDDEGAFLVWLKQFFDGNPLYDSVHAQYGPLYFAWQRIAHSMMGSGPSHDSLRFVSVTLWVLIGSLSFLTIYRLVGSPLIAAAGQFLVFFTSRFIGAEAGHPQDGCLLILVGFVLAATLDRNRRLQAAAMGMLAGAALAVKVNAGLYTGIALAGALAFSWRPGRLKGVFRIGFGVMAAATPLLMMRAHLGEHWAQEYAGLVVLAFAAIMLTASRFGGDDSRGFRDAMAAAGGLVIGAAASCAFALAYGSTIRAMWNSLIVFPGTTFLHGWFFEPPLPRSGVALTVVGLILAWYVSRNPNFTRIFWLKLAFGVMMLVVLPGWGFLNVFALAPGFLWLVIVPSNEAQASQGIPFGRLILAFAAAAYLLYAYPVAGAQVQFATVLPLIIATICLGDALKILQTSVPSPLQRHIRTAAFMGASALLVMYSFYAWRSYHTYHSNEAVDFPGANRLHLPVAQAQVLRSIVAETASCGTLVTVPPEHSFNIWSRKPVVAALTSYAWLSGLSDQELQQVASSLAPDRNPCVIYSRFWADHFTRGQGAASLAWARPIFTEFTTVFEVGDYQFMRRPQ